MVGIGINGYGRIGRSILRQSLQNEETTVKAVNDPMGPQQAENLTKHDTVYGHLDQTVRHKEQSLHIDDRDIAFYSKTKPGQIPWENHQIDVIIESSGRFRTWSEAQKHHSNNQTTTILSCPPKDSRINQYVHGINHAEIKPSEKIISAASCTTNGVCPILQSIDQEFGIESSHMTTIHSYTGSQNLTDSPASPEKPRRSRAAAENIIPTTTGASDAVAQILPQLRNKFEATAVRVPTPNVSAIDLVANLKTQVSQDSINEKLREHASKSSVLRTADKEKVSSDVLHKKPASMLDLSRTQVTAGNHVKLFAWYDNEAGYASQMIGLARHVS
jgi:glyceraldehyde 3-phosphate dehydrogenase